MPADVDVPATGPVAAAVLAGGRSSRFGRDKALLEIGGETLLQRTVATLQAAVGDVLIVGPPERAEQAPGFAVVQDELPGIGPLGGIYTALRARPGRSVVTVAVDMPFLNAALLRHLVALASDADVVLPIVDGRGQQLHAVYGPATLPWIEAQIASGDYKIDRFFPHVRVHRVEEQELRRFDPALRSFQNVNTPELWEAALAELSAGPAPRERS
ncbi:MAG TPA: molybdenum cofactor guanylyltransferase [Dehalococcoidia bacterium]|jgi:molybdopterin-guanine dinucleotide biosynthesis protein A